jgi:hypothetical protein
MRFTPIGFSTSSHPPIVGHGRKEEHSLYKLGLSAVIYQVDALLRILEKASICFTCLQRSLSFATLS